MEWELVEVPGNPAPSLQDSTVDVVAAKIEPKLANVLIRQLNQVAKCSATSKEEWEEQCKLWPTSYHPAHDLDVRGFREVELPSIFNWMKTAIQLSKEGNAAIVVDPSSNQIIAKAKDETYHHDTAGEGNKFSEVKAEGTSCSLNESTLKDSKLFRSGTYLCKYKSLSMEVSCMNPWGWTKQKTSGLKPLSSQGCFSWHPLWHAAMVSIEKAAERDRMLFNSPTTITKPISNGHLEIDSDNEPAKQLKTDAKDKDQSTNGACCGDLSETTRPYLCTGFDIYLVWEPCAMCAMALVHQRLKRVFYTFPNPITGALGGVYRLHGEKSLNHHHNVFRISVPESYLNNLTEC